MNKNKNVLELYWRDTMKKIAIGKQSFEDIRKKDCFYIDKTDFIKDWWESTDDVTLITRPRRFGKTLNMDMLKCFFSNQYEGRKELFEGLDIWKDEKYRKLQGTYPAIFLSFADIKGNTFETARQQICIKILDLYEENEYLLEGDILGESEKAFYKSVSMDMSDAIISTSLNKLCVFMYKYYGKKVIIILDEYDTPMQEAYMNGYWDELVALTRSLFNSTFKTNPYLERGIMTGITRVSKESIFSDLNNLVVVTTTSNQYNTAFGFTEEEVFTALEEQEISDEKEKVKEWYDGFTFGNKKDIYNPWSIINYLKFKKYETYWADSSSNGLVNELIRTGSAEIKNTMETLMAGGIVEKNIDEQIVFEQLKTNKDAVWSLLLASGYLRVEAFRTEGRLNKKIYSLKLTNYEVEQMFGTMIERWFGGADVPYNEFINAMLNGDIESMNEYMNRVTRGVISYFDTGKTPSDEEPERFYHGLVLGLMVEQVDNYILNSNRESGYGRYDIMLEPIDKTNEKYPGIVIEFKVINPRKENTLEETVAAALKQIEEKNYDAELVKRGVKEENIHHYGFAFRGKEVLIDGR